MLKIAAMQGGMGVLDRLSCGEAGASVRAECGAVGFMVGGLTFIVIDVKKFEQRSWKLRVTSGGVLSIRIFNHARNRGRRPIQFRFAARSFAQ